MSVPPSFPEACAGAQAGGIQAVRTYSVTHPSTGWAGWPWSLTEVLRKQGNGGSVPPAHQTPECAGARDPHGLRIVARGLGLCLSHEL